MPSWNRTRGFWRLKSRIFGITHVLPPLPNVPFIVSFHLEVVINPEGKCVQNSTGMRAKTIRGIFPLSAVSIKLTTFKPVFLVSNKKTL